ncbi:AMP-binding enzyme, putative [Talaromyces stipitatus ATCC 10500]|uniref:AMP-binding enzyme, putative n=1 Tax=Talaromyces stipitatus (strain ATCC 10500 / CBS 375.48 / QM 6759 / NRRL 1006) TaxID=441959 RepID=B8M120_TALSN|nr:AMP-binding enzyme, putative [Talaromyces stipitatus ATCC 10500]EED21800.1 AMP-binding enzyme, putative [Talaromyces stipitatus ATCC 10500]
MLIRVSLTACAHVRCHASRSSFLLKQIISYNQTQHRRLSSLSNSNQLDLKNGSNLFRALTTHKPSSLAVKHTQSGRRFTYADLNRDITQSRERLIQKSNTARLSSLKGERVAFVAENDYDSVVMLFSILASDAIALPVSPSFPYPEIEYILNNADARMLLSTERSGSIADLFMRRDDLIVDVREAIMGSNSQREESLGQIDFPDVQDSNGGLMLYTSGTTNRPKGVFIPLSALQAQAQSLIEAWEYSPKDHLLHLLPLHHIHGIVNALLVPALAGSAIEFMHPSSPDAIWRRLAEPFLPNQKPGPEKINFLTGVPTLYTRLMSYLSELPTEVQTAAKQAISPDNLRLNISGSAALPTPTKSAWTELSSGNVLLERYGMTEVGMAISCGLDFKDRVDGSVGWPLPSVEARLWDTDKEEVIHPGEEIDKETGRERVGEIQLRGPTIFREYWDNPKATSESFVEGDDGKGAWFRTGDVAVRRVVKDSGKGSSGGWAQGPMYFIQGRLSVDIIKTGGEKVSSLEVERELLSLPEIAEAAVVGLPSETWGQKVAAVIVLKVQSTTQGNSKDSNNKYKRGGIMHLRRALSDRLAAYKLPQEVKVLSGPIPRNAMGKVNKKMLVKEVFGS